MQTLIWHFDLFPKSRILFFFFPQTHLPGPQRSCRSGPRTSKHRKNQKTLPNNAMQTSPHPPPSFILLFGFILRPVSVKLPGCTKPWPQKSKMGGLSHRKKEKKPPRRRKCRKCSHELPLGWRDVQARWSVSGTWRSSLGPRGMVSPISAIPAWNNSDEVTAQQLFGMSSYRKLCRIPDEPRADPFQLKPFWICTIWPSLSLLPLPKTGDLELSPQNQEQKQRARSSHGLIIFVDEFSKQTRNPKPVEPTQRESSLHCFNDSLDSNTGICLSACTAWVPEPWSWRGTAKGQNPGSSMFTAGLKSPFIPHFTGGSPNKREPWNSVGGQESFLCPPFPAAIINKMNEALSPQFL